MRDEAAAAFTSLMQSDVSRFRAAIQGLPVSHVWRGYGSALFLEFGKLTVKVFRNGVRKSEGEFGLMIEWSWRIEDQSSIICGSWSDEQLWQPAFDRLVGKHVVDISPFGRLPEIAVSLSGDMHVVSFMTAEGQPSWALFDRRTPGKTGWMHSRNGRLGESADEDANPYPTKEV